MLYEAYDTIQRGIKLFDAELENASPNSTFDRVQGQSNVRWLINEVADNKVYITYIADL